MARGAPVAPAGDSPLDSACLAEVWPRILPQVVPGHARRSGRGPGARPLTIPFAPDLAVAFVVDEPDRYRYVTHDLARRWSVGAADLLRVALANLRRVSAGAAWKQIGSGARAVFLCETFDGYDASRILLTRELSVLVGRVAGNPVIGIPHRDFLVVAGDADRRLVADLEAAVREDFLHARYPISPHLYTLW